ncbi:MAG TPA: hypothetical protein VF044_05865 [Actinomycetota bacterium]
MTFEPSPGPIGELSRRLTSEFVVHSVRPTSTGLVGNSSGPALRTPPATGLRKCSTARPSSVTTAIAFALVDRGEDVLVVVERVRRLAPALGDRDRPRRQAADVASDAEVVGDRLHAEDLLRHAVSPDPPDAALPRAAVGDPEVAAAVEGDAVGAGTPVAKTVAVGGAPASGRRTMIRPDSAM